ncbi:hypothetical protein [Hamadaea tsunoensis]|uniref:hypothetical protein n=1 Tax=Hamadaea tsunoensis TaxID=53368 RepID=UPI0012FA62B5|nr:hypothetical protein [Hamadaea tsunoensis]
MRLSQADTPVYLSPGQAVKDRWRTTPTRHARMPDEQFTIGRHRIDEATLGNIVEWVGATVAFGPGSTPYGCRMRR